MKKRNAILAGVLAIVGVISSVWIVAKKVGTTFEKVDKSCAQMKRENPYYRDKTGEAAWNALSPEEQTNLKKYFNWTKELIIKMKLGLCEIREMLDLLPKKD